MRATPRSRVLCGAVRSLQEKSRLARHLAETVTSGMFAERYRATAEETEHALAVLTERLAVTGPWHGEDDA